MRAHKQAGTGKISVYTSVHTPNVDTSRKAAVLNRADARYWAKPGRLFKHTRQLRGQAVTDTTYSLKIAFDGKREQFNTGERDKAAAAAVAAEIYRTLDRSGWDPTLERFKPGKLVRADVAKGINVEPTVGEFIAAAMKLAEVRPRTMGDYCRSFRLIVAHVAGIAKDNTRYDYVKGGAERWREQVDAVKLSSVTPQKVQAWKVAFVARAGGDPLAESSAKVSVNSLMRQANALFSVKKRRNQVALLSMIQSIMHLPSPLPFDGVGFHEDESMGYLSKIDAGALLTAARDELAQSQPEAFKAVVLALCCGLRRNEIDKLTWRQVDFDKALIRIQTTRFFKAKSKDSSGEVDLDPELVVLLREWKANTKGEFVIEAAALPRLSKSYQHYRTSRIMTKLTPWLREHGVEDTKALHTLRKEFGSMVAQDQGIYAASRALRHADIQVTAKYYLDKKQRITIGFGRLLKPQAVALEPSDQPRDKSKPAAPANATVRQKRAR